MRERLGLVTATLAEDISGMRVVQSFTREPAQRARFRGVNERYRAANHETVVQNASTSRPSTCSRRAATAIVLGYGGWLVFDGDMTIGTLLAFTLYLLELLRPGPAALAALQHVPLRRSRRSTRSWTCSTRSRRSSTRPGRSTCRASRATSASTASASATATGPEVLHGIDLDVPAGTTVALVGHTGAGKSTIAKLLARFYDPTEGRDHDRRRRPARRHAGVAAPPARDRAAGGLPLRRHRRREHRLRPPRRARARRSSAAARAVGADDFIERLEDGYDTQLGERGFRLSLGQRQLVAFARALLADPRILILDEATSSVDIGTERQIERALRRLLAGRTAFVIAHRLSTIRDADLIVVLEHGRDRRAGHARRAPRRAAACYTEPLRRLGRGRRCRPLDSRA